VESFRVSKIGIYILFLMLTLVFVNSSSYPQFEFAKDSLNLGNDSVFFKSSSGTQIELYINGALYAKKDIIDENRKVILNGNSIEDITIGLGGKITFFNDGSRPYIITISNGTSKTLNFADSLIFESSIMEEISYKDDYDGTEKKIKVVDKLISSSFLGASSSLINGENNITFVQKFPYPTFNETKYNEYELKYEKYINKIDIDPFEEITANKSITLSGKVEYSPYPLYYTLNTDPSNLVNSGLLKSIKVSSNKFNITIDDLPNGKNNIYFLTTAENNKNVFTGYKKVEIEVDTIPPKIKIESAYIVKDKEQIVLDMSSENYINENKLYLNISVDAQKINYTLNNQNVSKDVVNDSILLELSLVKGQNNLTLIAIDKAQNKAKQAHTIYFDNTKPKIIPASLEPAEMFSKNTARFIFQQIEGNTSKPNVEITIFTFAKGTEGEDGKSATCSDFEPLFYRSYDSKKDNEGLDDIQISLSNLIFQKTTVTSDASSRFKALIGFQESNLDADNSDSKSNPVVDKVKSPNTVCFVLKDQYGNTGVYSTNVNLDMGNTLWKPAEITTVPNTVYASEIENTGDKKYGDTKSRVGITARFQYVGQGKISKLTSFRISEDSSLYKESRYISIVSGSTYYKLDKDTGELIVYFQIEISPLKMNPVDYPGELNLAFQAKPVYSVDDVDIPIDTKNPIYFQTSVNVEKPLDHSKWLTPELIDDWVGFLNNSIEFTEKMAGFTADASIVGVLACTGAKFWYGMQKAMYEEGSDELNQAKKKLFMICDRVACTASPSECSQTEEGKFFNFDTNSNNPYTLSQTQLLYDSKTEFISDDEEDKILAKITDFKVINPKYDAKTDCYVNGKPGVLINAHVETYQEDPSILGSWQSIDKESKRYLKAQCVEANWVDKEGKTCNKETGENCVLGGVNIQGISNVCFHEGPPHFDETRCNFFGSDPSGNPGWDPADNIIESIRCGCITDTYSHLKNYLKIQKSIRQCLLEAKIGNVEGSYCERLIGVAVCDIATNIMFKTLGQKTNDRTGTDDNDPHEVGFMDALKGASDGDRILNERYKGTFYSQSGLGTQQIVNKACLGAISGDWSIFTENILSSINENEVEPIFGPMMPISRYEGYNPLTGEASIMYRLTYAGVSGGQRISSEIELICDSTAKGGEHCPSGIYNYKEIGSSFKIGKQYIAKDGSKQDLIVIHDTNAKFRYNVVRIIHKYAIKGEEITKVYEEPITHKGEFMLASCYFSAGVLGEGAGIKCDVLFDEQADGIYSIDSTKSYIIPQKNKVFYKGNTISMFVSGTAIKEYSSSADLAYMAICKGLKDSKSIKKESKSISVSDSYINTVVKLFEIPDIGKAENTQYSTYSLKFTQEIIEELKTANNIKISFYSNDKETQEHISIDTKTDLGDLFQIQGLSNEQTVLYKEVGKISEGDNVFDIIIKQDDSELKDKSFEIKLKSKPTNLAISIVYKKEDKEEILSFSKQDYEVDSGSESFAGLQEGTCELIVRLLPEGKGTTALLSEDFENYDPFGENIQTSKNLKSKDTFKTTFTVSAKTDVKKQTFDFLYPKDSSAICISKNKKTFNIGSILYSSAELEGSSNLILNIKLKQYSTEIFKQQTISKQIYDGNNQQIIDKITLDITDDDISKMIGKQSATLFYKIDLKDGDKTTTKEENIPFYIHFTEECDSEDFNIN